MKRTRSAKSRRGRLSPLAWAFINDAPLPSTFDPWELFCLQFDHYDRELGYRASDLWKLHSDAILRAWVKEKPGTRPKCWWKYSAPEPRQNESQRAYLARHDFLTPMEIKPDD